MSPRAHAHATFKLQGIVGTIRTAPHDRYVGKVVVVEMHVQPVRSGDPSQRKSSLLEPWYILFEDETKIQGIQTGMVLEVSGTLERSVESPASGGSSSTQRHLRPMTHFCWGDQWRQIENPLS